jgi:hypothetical protein
MLENNPFPSQFELSDLPVAFLVHADKSQTILSNHSQYYVCANAHLQNIRLALHMRKSYVVQILDCFLLFR